MNDSFPSYDLPSSVPSESAPTAFESGGTGASTPPPPSAPAPAAPPAPEPPADPLWAPMTAQAQAEAEAGEDQIAAPPPNQPAPRPQPSAVEAAILQQGELIARIADRVAGQPRQPQPQGQPPAPRDPKSVAVEQALLKHIPQLAPLLTALQDPQKAQALSVILDSAPGHQAQVQQFYRDFADQTAGVLAKSYAEAYGLDPKSIDRETENDLTDQFSTWIQRPGNEQLLQRYEMGDLRVVENFNAYFRQRFVSPAKRQGVAQVASRGRVVGALPRGGGSTIPTPSQSAPRRPQGERDVFTEAWHDLQAQRTAG